eukprot:CAMPEP_0177605914 /NCGR_PEP_ID=MMETSP0419_2-20121207/16992_1 /TAXON_ID=582737 /ORGANISM="Tetraselmis sp., Strain GSL018" /LENGTH=165 /DNA_ID=CAMNT_0019100169 /DNA_START=305 /DNA_END=804 /DNA_ORIENTATION=+
MSGAGTGDARDPPLWFVPESGPLGVCGVSGSGGNQVQGLDVPALELGCAGDGEEAAPKLLGVLLASKRQPFWPRRALPRELGHQHRRPAGEAQQRVVSSRSRSAVVAASGRRWALGMVRPEEEEEKAWGNGRASVGPDSANIKPSTGIKGGGEAPMVPPWLDQIP